MWRGVHARLREGAAPWVYVPDWMRSWPHAVAFCVLAAANLFYLLAADRLGFILTGSIYLAAIMAVLRVHVVRAAVIAIAMTLIIHYAFYKLLRVPLPWGVLQSVAW